jgi:hypothetical protein
MGSQNPDYSSVFGSDTDHHVLQKVVPHCLSKTLQVRGPKHQEPYI